MMIFKISSLLTIVLVLFFQDTVTAVSVPRDDESHWKNITILTLTSAFSDIPTAGACGAKYASYYPVAYLPAEDTYYNTHCQMNISVTHAGFTATAEVLDFMQCPPGICSGSKYVILSPIVYEALTGALPKDGAIPNVQGDLTFL